MTRLAWLCVQADAATDEVYARLALVAEGEVKMSLKKSPDWIRMFMGTLRFMFPVFGEDFWVDMCVNPVSFSVGSVQCGVSVCTVCVRVSF
jgi:hypothetical protein